MTAIAKSKRTKTNKEFVSFEQAREHFFPNEVQRTRMQKETPEDAGKRIAESVLNSVLSRRLSKI